MGWYLQKQWLLWIKNHILLFFPSISNLMMKWALPVVIKVFCQKTENQGLNGFLSALRYIVEFYVCHSLKFIEKFVLRVTAYFVLLFTLSVTYYCMLDVVMVLNWLNEWTMNRLINRQFLWFKIFLLGVIFYKLVWLHFSFFGFWWERESKLNWCDDDDESRKCLNCIIDL